VSVLDPGQREHELSEALVTLLIAASRFGDDNDAVRPTADRLDLVAHVTLLVAHEVAERVRALRGKEAAAAFRKALGQRSSP
jgi:hypothetical protein